jgi:hypothetical protein
MAKTKHNDADGAPSIELYMYSLNQEFPAGKGHSTYLKRKSELQESLTGELEEQVALETQVFSDEWLAEPAKAPAAWSVQWISNKWITNHTKAIGVGRRPDLDSITSSILRREDFGGILFDPVTDRVYKLNKAGADLFEQMQDRQKETGKPASEAELKGHKSEAVERFVGQMKAAGLLGAE